MFTTSRRSLYALLKKFGHPRIDKGFTSSTPVFRQADFLDRKRIGSDFGSSAPFGKARIDRDYSPSTPISRGQVDALIHDVSWINWSVATKRDDDQQGTAQAVLRPAVDEGFKPLRAEPGAVYASFVHLPVVAFAFVLVGLLKLGVVGVFIAVLLFGAALGGIFQLAGTTPGLVGIAAAVGAAATLYALDARRNRYIRTVHAIDTWLSTAGELTERIPREWSQALQEAEVRDLVIEWMRTRPEIDALEAHITRGVKLRKHLSPVDPRRRTMQAEIEAQLSKRDALIELRKDRANVITGTARAHLAKQEQARDAELKRAREARAAQLEREEYQRRWNEIDAKEQARVRTHEQIDGWFDDGSSTREH